MKNKLKYVWLLFLTTILSFSLWGCGAITTGDEELDQAIVDFVVDGIDSYLEETPNDTEAAENAAATVTPKPTATPTPTVTQKPTATPEPTPTPTLTPAIDEDGWYYSKEEVSLYLYTYGKLPENFITKSEAQDLGWSGGSVEHYKEGAAIGGDKFGNREGILPKKSGRQYYECDIDTNGENSRGAKRIVFSNDGLIYYTEDHYETFTLLYGEE